MSNRMESVPEAAETRLGQARIGLRDAVDSGDQERVEDAIETLAYAELDHAFPGRPVLCDECGSQWPDIHRTACKKNLARRLTAE